jgi:hypothetical protein
MREVDIIPKLEQAQRLLAEVYDYACQNGLYEVERLMSFADTCIYDALDEIEVTNGLE